MIELSRRDARRVAVRAQLLTVPRPADLMTVARGLGGVQVDHTTHVAPSAELVFWSRLGSRVSRDEVARAVEDRELVEVRGVLRPARDVRLFTGEMASWPGEGPDWRLATARWVDDNHGARDEVLAQLRSDGPLPARAMSADFVRPWRSSGWNGDKNVLMMLERLEECGRVAVSHREGRERVWDLAERVYPDDPPLLPVADAVAERDRRRLRALGIARATGPDCQDEPLHGGAAGEPARVEAVRGTWRVDAELLDQPFRGRTAVLSPLDRLLFDRKRMAELFEFDYALEMYKPAEVRRWGYWALPVLHGDRLVGKVDAQALPAEGELLVHAVHEDDPWSASLRGAVEAELRSLARFLGLALQR